MKYTAKKTRHKYTERYNIHFANGMKGEVTRSPNDQFWNVCYGNLLVVKDFEDFDDCVQYCFKKQCEIRENMKTMLVIA